MTDSAQQADALLTEHFQYTSLVRALQIILFQINTNFSSQSLIDEIINVVNIVIYHALEVIENDLLSLSFSTLKFDAENSFVDLSIQNIDDDDNIEYSEATTEIEDNVHQLETLLKATMNKTFDKFEIYTLRNILMMSNKLTR